MNELYKNPVERELIEIDFGPRLIDDETISSATVVVLRKNPSGSWTDVTTQFRSDESNPTASDSVVSFWLRARSGNEQFPGTYALRVAATTSQSSRIVVALDDEGELPRLVVSEA